MCLWSSNLGRWSSSYTQFTSSLHYYYNYYFAGGLERTRDLRAHRTSRNHSGPLGSPYVPKPPKTTWAKGGPPRTRDLRAHHASRNNSGPPSSPYVPKPLEPPGRRGGGGAGRGGGHPPSRFTVRPKTTSATRARFSALEGHISGFFILMCRRRPKFCWNLKSSIEFK